MEQNNKLSPPIKIALWGGGFDLPTMEKCSTGEVNRKALLGATVFIPPTLALFSWGYFIKLMTDNIIAIYGGGIICSGIILTIDRAIVGYGKLQDMSKVLIFLRFMMGATISASISEPAITAVFNDAIEEQQQLELSQKRDAVTYKFDGQIDTLTVRLQQAKTIVDAKQQSYLNEIDGNGGSRKRGIGKIALQKQAAYEQEFDSYTLLKERLESKIARLEENKSRELAEVQSSFARGLLGSLQSLHAIKSHIVIFFVWVLRLLLLFIDLTPLILKVSKSEDDSDNYYKLLETSSTHQFSIQKKKEDLAAKQVIVKLETEKLKSFEQYASELLQAQYMSGSVLIDEITTIAAKKAEMEEHIINTVYDLKQQKQLLRRINKIFRNMTTTIHTLTSKMDEMYTAKIAEI